MSGRIEFPVFNDGHGNRFVFPGVYVSGERPYNWDRCRTLCAALRIKEEKDRLIVEPNDKGELAFPRVEASAGHPGFAHGSTDVWIIGGPTFDDIAKAEGLDEVGEQGIGVIADEPPPHR